MPISHYEGKGTLERAIAIAAMAHEGALDKGGAPYILHPLRVMLKQKLEAARIVGVLHDVVEDASVTIEELRDRSGFSEEVLEALSLVTRRRGDSYERFVERCSANPIACSVKLADLEDNLDALRLKRFDEAAARRFAKYLAAHRALSSAMGDTSV